MRKETAEILTLLDSFTLWTPEDEAMKIANDFRSRRVEKGITREEMAETSGVPSAILRVLSKRPYIIEKSYRTCQSSRLSVGNKEYFCRTKILNDRGFGINPQKLR